VQLPTAILRNLPTYLQYIDAIRADESEMNKLLVTVWDGLRDKHVVAALRVRSFVDVTFTKPMIFLHVPPPRDAPHDPDHHGRGRGLHRGRARALDVIGSKPAPTQQSIKVRVFVGLRAAGFDVAGLEAAYTAWWEGAGDAKGSSDGIAEAWEEATKKETWAYVSAFLHAAAGPMLATHRRNLDKDCIGISELEYTPIKTTWRAASPTST